MTRRDYVRIAAALRAAYPSDGPRNSGDLSRLAAGMQWHACADELARVLAADNPRFDRSRFMAAAEGGK